MESMLFNKHCLSPPSPGLVLLLQSLLNRSNDSANLLDRFDVPELPKIAIQAESQFVERIEQIRSKLCVVAHSIKEHCERVCTVTPDQRSEAFDKCIESSWISQLGIDLIFDDLSAAIDRYNSYLPATANHRNVIHIDCTTQPLNQQLQRSAFLMDAARESSLVLDNPDQFEARLKDVVNLIPSESRRVVLPVIRETHSRSIDCQPHPRSSPEEKRTQRILHHMVTWLDAIFEQLKVCNFAMAQLRDNVLKAIRIAPVQCPSLIHACHLAHITSLKLQFYHLSDFVSRLFRTVDSGSGVSVMIDALETEARNLREKFDIPPPVESIGNSSSIKEPAIRKDHLARPRPSAPVVRFSDDQPAKSSKKPSTSSQKLPSSLSLHESSSSSDEIEPTPSQPRKRRVEQKQMLPQPKRQRIEPKIDESESEAGSEIEECKSEESDSSKWQSKRDKSSFG